MNKSFAVTFMIAGLCLFRAEAQNSNLDYDFAIKLYNQSSYEEPVKYIYTEYTPSYAFLSTTNLQLLHPTIAFQWNRELSKSHEIELTSLSSETTNKTITIRNEGTGSEERVSQEEYSTTYVALRYEYIRNFNINKDSKFVPSFGGSVSPYFRKNEYTPDPASGDPSSQLTTGIRIHVIPRLTYHFNSKFFIDLNIPICTHDVAFQRNKIDSPLIPERQKNTHQFQFYQFPAFYSGRLGLGFKI